MGVLRSRRSRTASKMSASPSTCTGQGRMKGLIGFWNSKSVSETKSFRPSAVSIQSKTMRSSPETAENNLMKSSPKNIENKLMKNSPEYIGSKLMKSSPKTQENNPMKSSAKPLRNKNSKTNVFKCVENKPRKGSTEKIQN